MRYEPVPRVSPKVGLRKRAGRGVRAQAPQVPTHRSASDSGRFLHLSDVPGFLVKWICGM